jgi:hypothetical protein
MKKQILFVFFLCKLFFPANARADQAGALDFNHTLNRFEFFDGTSWYAFSAGLGLVGCTKKGALDFNELLSLYRYCNGTVWVPVVGTPTLILCTKRGAMDFFNQSYHYCNGLLWVNMRGMLVS